MTIWDNTVKLEELSKQRETLRSRGKRLSFDCFNLKLEGGRAKCSLGRLLGQAKDGSVDLITVLRGVTSGTCLKCKDFNTEEFGSN